MLIHMVWDTSGSMGEWGKLFIARGVARALEQYLRLDYGSAALRLVAWSNEARFVDWHDDDELPAELLLASGAASCGAFISFLELKPQDRVLLLTDGFWSPSEEREMKRWRGGLQPGALRIIKIGADANPRLKGSEVFAAEDLFAALDGWLEGSAA